MVEVLKGPIVEIPKGEKVNKNIILVADKNYYSHLKIEGAVTGDVSVFKESAASGGLCPTNTRVFILPGGSLSGDISDIDNVDISGECSGDIKARIVTIRKGAVVRGNISCIVLYGEGDTEVQGQVVSCFRKAITTSL